MIFITFTVPWAHFSDLNPSRGINYIQLEKMVRNALNRKKNWAPDEHNFQLNPSRGINYNQFMRLSRDDQVMFFWFKSPSNLYVDWFKNMPREGCRHTDLKIVLTWLMAHGTQKGENWLKSKQKFTKVIKLKPTRSFYIKIRPVSNEHIYKIRKMVLLSVLCIWRIYYTVTLYHTWKYSVKI